MRSIAHAPRTMHHLFRMLGCWFLVLSLSGCLLMSGPIESTDATGDGGNVYVSFVSAEGSEARTVTTDFPNQDLDVTLIAQAGSGALKVEVMDTGNSVSMTVDGQAEEQVSFGTVRTDGTGAFRYRIRATGAQRGTIQLLYQPLVGTQ